MRLGLKTSEKLADRAASARPMNIFRIITLHGICGDSTGFWERPRLRKPIRGVGNRGDCRYIYRQAIQLVRRIPTLLKETLPWILEESLAECRALRRGRTSLCRFPTIRRRHSVSIIKPMIGPCSNFAKYLGNRFVLLTRLGRFC